MNEKPIIGLTEEVTVKGITEKKVIARIDTGATRSSIDHKLAEELNLGPAKKKVKVKSATGTETRDVIHAIITIKNHTIKASFTLADRKHMKYHLLIGRNILKHGFLIDTTQS